MTDVAGPLVVVTKLLVPGVRAESIARDRLTRIVVLVLDHDHLVTDTVCHRLILDLIDAAPPGVRMLVSSRGDGRRDRARSAGLSPRYGARTCS